jgi:hypothetical protein
MTDRTSNSPPEVVIDKEGIGARLRGVLSYYIRWSEIQTIHIDVISYKEAGAEAFWVIDGESPKPGSPSFGPYCRK